MKYALIHILVLMLAFCTSGKAQNKTALPNADTKTVNKEIKTYNGPKTVTRNIIQDRKGNIWMASSDGIFKYDGKSFTNITDKVSSARFFSVLEDSKGNFWFGSTGSGVYHYDGKSFTNFTTKDGLVNNEVTNIYEDRTGNIWLGTNGGASRYDGKSFKNYTTKEGLQSNDINSIIEDKTGKLWFGARGYASVYDGKTFTVLTRKGKPFLNIRSIIQDKKRNIWLGGSDGLWCYDGRTYTKLTDDFVGYVYEDKKGNIWTSSESSGDNFPSLQGDSMPSGPGNNARGWVLSRYDEKFLLNEKPTVTKIKPEDGAKSTLFGILEVNDGSIWVGTESGLYRYDGNTLNNLNGTGPVSRSGMQFK